jgi:hypothetical protein
MTRTRKPTGKAPLMARARQTGDYVRLRGERRTYPTIIILCEGEDPEPGYFRALKRDQANPGLQIVVIPGGEALSDPEHLLAEAARRRRKLEWDPDQDQIWCVFDVERPGTRPDLKALIETAAAQQIHLAVSNPAFEYWYVLHFDDTDRPFLDAGELIDHLRRHIPTYDKATVMYWLIKSLTGRALHYCGSVRKRSDAEVMYPNPSTTVDELVRLIWRA